MYFQTKNGDINIRERQITIHVFFGTSNLRYLSNPMEDSRLLETGWPKTSTKWKKLGWDSEWETCHFVFTLFGSQFIRIRSALFCGHYLIGVCAKPQLPFINFVITWQI